MPSLLLREVIFLSKFATCLSVLHISGAVFWFDFQIWYITSKGQQSNSLPFNVVNKKLQTRQPSAVFSASQNTHHTYIYVKFSLLRKCCTYSKNGTDTNCRKYHLRKDMLVIFHFVLAIAIKDSEGYKKGRFGEQ